MKFTVADLLDQLSADQPIATAVLAKTLKLTKQSDKQSLEMALSALGRLGVIDSSDGEGVRRGGNPDLIEARLRCSSKGFCFAIRDDGGDDIYIRDHQLNHAWNGDRVLVRILREGGRRRSPEGGVQCILERATTTLLGQVEQQEDHFVAVPLDDRLLTSIRLPEGDADHLQQDPPTSVVEIRVDRYPVAQCPAEGHVARSLPLSGGPASDRDLLLTKAGLQDRAPAPRVSSKTPPPKGRTDLSEQPALLLRSWTSAEAPALPAVHVEPHAGGSRLWIHVPSVAERLGSGNSLDLWLRERSEAICLGEVWQPLLNNALNKASQFNVGESAEAISVRLDINADGDLSDWSFMLSTIRPIASVGPEQLKALAARKPKARTIPVALKAIKDQLGQLETLIFCARCLIENEQRQGAIQLDLRAPAIEALGDLVWADPTGLRHRWFDAIDATDPQSLLQPLLRAAHRAWGRHARALQLPGIQLLCGLADDAVLTDVAKTAVALELPLELNDEGSPSAAELIAAFEGVPQRRVLEQQLSHALQEGLFASLETANEPQAVNASASQDADAATPSSADDAAPLLPWCCPGVNYVDLANQQVIVALLSDGKDRPTVRHKQRLTLGNRDAAAEVAWPLFTASLEEKLQQLCSERFIQKLNGRRRQVLELERDLVAMVQARTAEPLLNQELDGQISGVQSYGFFVEVGPAAVEGLVHVSSLNDDWYEYRSRQNRLVGRKNRRTYQLGDAVRVKVIKVDVLRNQIDLEVASEPDLETTAPAEQESLLPVTLSNH